MALINCPECGKEISDRADKCIHCGFPIDQNSASIEQKDQVTVLQAQPPSKRKKYITICVLAALGIMLVYLLVPKCSHEWNPATVKSPKTCSICGHTEGKALECTHKWTPATCTSPKTCAYCGRTDGKALGGEHDYSEATLTEPAKCVICGYSPIYSHPIPTDKIMGTWVAEYYVDEGKVVSGNEADLEAKFSSDGTGRIELNGVVYSIKWSFSKETEDMLMYKVKMNGDTRYIGYVTDVFNDFYRKLVFELGDDLHIILKKDSIL